MFTAECAREFSQGSIESCATLKPCSVYAVTSAKKIAAPDALQTDKDMTMIPRINALQFVRKFEGTSRSDTRGFSRPFSFRPRGGGEKHYLMAGGEDSMGQTPQIGLGTAARGKPAANESNFQIFRRHQVFTCTASAQYLFACRVKP